MPDEIDLSYRPAAYWPEGEPPEEDVELAQIVVDSHLGDVNQVVARPAGDGRIEFAVLSDGGGTLCDLERSTADRPLSLGELIELIDTADLGELKPGVVLGILDLNSLVGSGNPEDANFITVGSEIYPGLGEHYDAQILAWVMGT